MVCTLAACFSTVKFDLRIVRHLLLAIVYVYSCFVRIVDLFQ